VNLIYPHTADRKPIVPIINSSHPLAAGLTAAWFLTESGGLVAADAKGQKHLAASGTAPVWCSTPYGSALSFSAGRMQNTSAPISQYITAAECTVVARVLIRSSASATVPEDLPAIFSDDGGLFALAVGDIGGTNALWAYNWDGTSDRRSATYTTNVWITAALVHTAGRLHIATNGGASSSISSGNTTDLTSGVRIGQNFNGAANFDGVIDYVLTYNIALRPTDIRALHTAPYSILVPATKIQIPSAVATASPGFTLLGVG
jgi:hypothetical protein